MLLFAHSGNAAAKQRALDFKKPRCDSEIRMLGRGPDHSVGARFRDGEVAIGTRAPVHAECAFGRTQPHENPAAAGAPGGGSPNGMVGRTPQQ